MPGGPELIIILVVVLVLFGGSQLPKLAKNLGKAQKEFKDGVGEGADASTAQPPAAPSVQPPAPSVQPPAPPSSAMPPPPPPAAPQQ
jgi:sec-independent protein translocase protein TatA